MTRLTGLARATVLVLTMACAACPIVDDELPGAPCDDDDDCPTAFTCTDSVCTPAVDGDEGEGEVGEGEGEPAVGCETLADGDACGDGDPCTIDDVCVDGACIGAPKPCGEGEVCSASAGGACIDLGDCSLPGTAERLTNTPGVSGSVSLAYDPERNQIAAAFDDDVTGLSEIFVQLLDGDTAAPIGAAVQITEGVAASKNETDQQSFQPSIVFSSEQDEYALAWTAVGGDIIGISVDAFAVTLTSSIVPATTHDIMRSGLSAVFSVGPVALAATGAGYGAAWVDDRNSTDQVTTFDVFFARLEDDGSPVSTLSNRQISPGDEVGGNIALAFNPRTTDFAIVYRVAGAPGSLQLTLTNIDGEAPRDSVVSLSGDPFEPAIALTPTGYAIAWRDDDAVEGTLGPLDFALVDDAGSAGAQKRLTDDGERAGRPSLVVVPGGFALAYAALVDEAQPDVLEVRLRILDEGGDPVSAGPARVLGSGQRPSQVALPTGVAVGWQQISGAESDVFASAQCLAD